MSRESVTIWEVGPRDGLQSQNSVLPAEVRAEYTRLLLESGLQHIEAGSFVSPKWVPAMASAAEIYDLLKDRRENLSFLVPNERGLDAALEAGVAEIAVFTAASESFCQKNINKSIAESIEAYRTVCSRALAAGVRVRGYVSTVTHCPYEGGIDPAGVVDVASQLADLGVYEISLGETLGRAVPSEVKRLLEKMAAAFKPAMLAGHFHDTYGTALANTSAALEFGLRTFDSSSGGIGGCPYAPGAAGNVATEELVYFFEQSGYSTGVDLAKLARASDYIAGQLNTPLRSRVYQALKNG